MGIENREYLRDEYDDGTGGVRRRASMPMTVILVAVTVAVFVLQLLTSQGRGGASLVQEWLALNADDVLSRGQIWRLLTYAFCHDQGNIFHIVFNMMVLYSIGGVLRQLLAFTVLSTGLSEDISFARREAGFAFAADFFEDGVHLGTQV